jgi:hypothetical protein
VGARELELVEAQPGGGDVGQATGRREARRGRRAAVGGADGKHGGAGSKQDGCTPAGAAAGSDVEGIR